MGKIVFRVDSSLQIGSGHLMRCLTLAAQLREKTEVVFISRDLEGNLNHLIKEKGYLIFVLPGASLEPGLSGYEKWLTVKVDTDAKETKEILQMLDAECVIIDHYALDETWEKIVRPYARKIMVIDDLANRQHDCDILLDQNYYCDLERRYADLVPAACKLLLGPGYAILREEFQQARKTRRLRDGIIRNIFIFFGGSDLGNETMKALLAVKALHRPDITVNVVVGASNPHQGDIKKICAQHAEVHFHCQVDYMAKLMNEADLAIGAGGATTWERCYLGLPAIVIGIAENQVQISKDCAAAGLIVYAGESDCVSVNEIARMIKRFFNAPQCNLSLQKKGLALFDGIDLEDVSKEIIDLHCVTGMDKCLD